HHQRRVVRRNRGTAAASESGSIAGDRDRPLPVACRNDRHFGVRRSDRPDRRGNSNEPSGHYLRAVSTTTHAHALCKIGRLVRVGGMRGNRFSDASKERNMKEETLTKIP